MIEVLFRVDDGSGIGVGHLMRCRALAEAIHAVGGRVHLLAATASPLHRDWLADGARVNVHGHAIGSEADLVATLRHGMDVSADWWVVDGYAFDQDWLDRLAARHRLLYLDDLGTRNAGAALVLNHNAGSESRYGMAYARAGRALLGTEWFLLRRAWREARPQPNPGRILVTLGGDDRANLALAVMRALIADGRDFVADIVCSAPVSGFEAARMFAVYHPERFALHRAPTDLVPLMACAAVVICGGGVTPLEAASLGVPAVIKVLADNQSPGALALAAEGAAVLAGGPGNVEDIVRMALDLLNDDAARTMMAKRARALVDGQGAARVVEVMMETMQ